MSGQPPYTMWCQRDSSMYLHTGHTLDEFDLLYECMQTPLINYYRHRATYVTSNVDEPGLTPHNMLCLTLYYIRHYFPFRFICDDFDISITTLHDIVDYVITQLYSISDVFILFNPSYLQSYDNSSETLPNVHLIIDSSPIAIEQPEHTMTRKQYYHMKSFTRYGLKFQIAIDLWGHIVHVSSVVVGSVHDSKLYRDSSLLTHINNRMKVLGDKGYQGCENFITPFKKPRGRELNENEKGHNYTVDSQRVVVENVFHRMKQYRIIGDIYRGDRADTQKVTHIVHVIAALTNINMLSHPLRS
jgi:hypothetical protein